MTTPIRNNERSILELITTYQCESRVNRVLSQFDDKTAPWFAEVAVIDNDTSVLTLQNSKKSIDELAPLAKRYGVILTRLFSTTKFNLSAIFKAVYTKELDKGYQHVVILHGVEEVNLCDRIHSTVRFEAALPQIEKWLQQRLLGFLNYKFTVPRINYLVSSFHSSHVEKGVHYV